MVVIGAILQSLKIAESLLCQFLNVIQLKNIIFQYSEMMQLSLLPMTKLNSAVSVVYLFLYLVYRFFICFS